MNAPRQTRATVTARAQTSPWRIWLAGSALVIAGAAWALPGWAQDTIITSHGYSTFGDLKYPADFAHLDYVNPDAPKGGEFSTSASGTFDTFNPYSREGRAGALATVGYESMLTGTSDEVSGAYCLLCTTLEYPESLDWVIFHMNPDAKFSDGTPLTAQDVVFSHNLAMEQAIPSYVEGVQQLISSVEAIDDYTVKYTFVPDAPLRPRISQAGSTPVWSKAWYERTGARLDEIQLEISPGSGPYVLDSYDLDRQIVYRRNPDYWGEDLPINIGRNNFDTIRIEYFADTTVALEGFKAGEFTFRVENSSLNWATAYDFPALDNAWVVKAELPNESLPSAVGIMFNLRRPLLQDIRVRQALALMYNFTWTNESLQFGLFEQRESFWQNSDMAASGVPEGRELELLQSVADLIDPAILTETVTMPHTSGDRPLDRGNLRIASDLLDAAGWIVGPDGVRTKDGQTLKLEFINDQPTFERIFSPYVENLISLGVDATYETVDPAQYTNRQRAFDWDILYDGYVNGLEESDSLSQRYSPEGLEDFNKAGYSSPAVDQLIDIVADATTREEMAAGVRAIDRIMRRELFLVPTYYKANYWVAYYDMYEHPETLPPYALGEMDFWWFNQEKYDALVAAGAFQQ
jgi:microcin C transport system substrate-binding protein